MSRLTKAALAALVGALLVGAAAYGSGQARAGDDADQLFIRRDVNLFAVLPDGVLGFDNRGRLWVAANQADEVVALNDAGRVVARLGEFRGLHPDGSPIGLLFRATS